MDGLAARILPLAFAVMISPVPIVAEIALLFSGRPRPNGGAYLAGFVAGVSAVLVSLLAVVHTGEGTGPGSGASTALSWIQVALGVLVLFAAARRYRARPARGEEAPMPSWMSGIATFGPARSLGVGVAVGALNPKNVVVGLSAAAVIEGASVSGGARVGAAALYVGVASLGVAAPFVVAVSMGESAGPVLESWKAWLARNNAVVMTVLLGVIGAALVGNGIAELVA